LTTPGERAACNGKVGPGFWCDSARRRYEAAASSWKALQNAVRPFYDRCMATHAEKTWDLPFSPEKVIDAIRNPALIERAEKRRDALDVKVEDKDRSDEHHRYTIHTKAYAVTVTGIDRKKTEQHRTEVEMDLQRKRGTWEWFGSHENVTVKGAYLTEPTQNGCKLTLTVDIDVRIFGVGGMVEKKVRAGFEDAWPGYVDLVREYAS
jgi:hypothetical protein